MLELVLCWFKVLKVRYFLFFVTLANTSVIQTTYLFKSLHCFLGDENSPVWICSVQTAPQLWQVSPWTHHASLLHDDQYLSPAYSFSSLATFAVLIFCTVRSHRQLFMIARSVLVSTTAHCWLVVRLEISSLPWLFNRWLPCMLSFLLLRMMMVTLVAGTPIASFLV